MSVKPPAAAPKPAAAKPAPPKPATPKPAASKPATSTSGSSSGSSGSISSKPAGSTGSSTGSGTTKTSTTDKTSSLESSKNGNSLTDEKSAATKAKSFKDNWLEHLHGNEEKDAGGADQDAKAGGEEKKAEDAQQANAEEAPEKDSKTTEKLDTEFSDRMKTLAGENPGQLEAILKQSFDKASPEQLEKLKKDAAEGKLPAPEKVSFVEPGQLNGAQAAYSAENGGSILLSESLKADPQALSRAYTEEMGHHLDAQYSSGDSSGDEGRIFQEGLEKGGPLSEQRLQELRQQDDKGVAMIDGQLRQVENRREPSLASRYEGAEDRHTEATQKLDQAKESLERHNGWLNQQKEAARYQARGEHQSVLPKAEDAYHELLRKENRTEDEDKRLGDLGRYANQFYGRGDISFTSLAGKQYSLERNRDAAQAELGQAQDGKRALQEQTNALAPEERDKVVAEYHGRISNGERVGKPQNLSAQQKQHLATLDDPQASIQDKRMALSRLRMDMTGGGNTDTATEPGIADELAKRMQGGDKGAYEALKSAAFKSDGSPQNPRAHQLLQKLELSKGEKAALDQRISELRDSDGLMDRNDLRDQFRNRGAAADYMTESMTNYIASHTSDEQSDKSRDYPTAFQNPGAQEKFLQEMSKKNPGLGDKVEIAKLGQARMDLLEARGANSQEVREQAHQKLQSALLDPEKAPAVRDFFASYEGELSTGAHFLSEKKDYDSLALLSQAKDTSGFGTGLDFRLKEGGRDAAEAVQRQYEHLNERGRKTAGDFFEGSMRDDLKAWVGEGGVDGLSQSVADSIQHATPRGNQEYLGVNSRLEALVEAKTGQSREALASLSGDERKTYQGGRTIGQEALQALESDSQGRERYFEALRSDDEASRRNALRVEPSIGFTTGFVNKEAEYTSAEREEFLSSSVQALGKTKEPELRKNAMKSIREVGVEDPNKRFGNHDPASFESRAEAYGGLHAQADQLDPNSAEFSELRTLADGLGQAGLSGSEDQLNTRNEIQERLNDSALGEDNETLAHLVGVSDTRSLALADARLRHAGDHEGLVGRLDEMRRHDPASYHKLLHESSKDRGFQRPGELADFLNDKAQDSSQSTASQLAQDVKRTQDFTARVKELEAQREQLKRAGQDSSAIDHKILAATTEYENQRFDSLGEQGRLDAKESLGEQYGQIQQIAQAQGLEGRDFDNLLMKSAELQRLGNQEGLNTLLELGAGPEGLKSSEMNLMMDMAQDMSPEQFDAMLTPGSSAGEVRERFADFMQQEVQDYAAGRADSPWFGEQGRLDTKGERATDFLVDKGRAGQLLYNPDGSGSAFDRMSNSADPAAQRIAARMADRIVDTSPQGTPLNNAGRLAQEKIKGAPKGEKPDATIARLEKLHGGTQGLSAEDRELQHRVNADLRYQQTKTILGRKTGQGANEAEAAVRAHTDLLQKIEADQSALPEGEKYKNENEKLEASRILTDGRLEAAKQGERGYELDRQKELMLGDDMNHRQIEAMLGMFLDSPTDELSFKVDAKLGVELQAALFGNAEAYVKGSLGISASEKEDGKLALSFSSAIGAGAGAQLGPGDKTLAKAAVEGEAFAQKSIEFSSKEEAARYLAQQMWDAQDALGMKPKGPRPEYTNPSHSLTTGTKYKETLQVGPVSFERQRENATKVKEQPKPWFAAEDDRLRETEIHSTKDRMSAQLDLGYNRNLAIAMEAEDQVGDKNNVGNGTTLQMALELGLPLGSSQKKIVDSTVENLMASTSKLDPSGGWKRGLSDEQIREKLTKQFGTGELKLNAKGSLELNFSSNANLMLNQDGTPKLKEDGTPVNGHDVFQSWMKDSLSGTTDALWQMNNVRVASELELNFSQRARYGTGIVNAFAEVGINAKYRDATTLAGSLLHGRFMLYGHTQGKAFDGDQVAELQKDGIIHSAGRDRGRIDNKALNYSLGRMRSEFDALYNNEEWRQKNLGLPDGSIMSQERFQQNIDEYLISARDAVYGGVEKSGKAQNRDAFKGEVNIESIRQAQDFLQSQGLMSEEEVHSYGRYLEHLGSLQTQPGIPSQLLNNTRNEVDRRLQNRLDALLGRPAA